MANQRQSATYFTFGGGLNTQASNLNANPQDARDLLNVYLTDAATVRRRPGIDFLPNLTTPYFTDSFNYTSLTSNFVDPAPSSISHTHVNEDGTTVQVLIIHMGRVVSIYNQDTLPTISNLSSPRQQIPLPVEFNTRAFVTKTRFIRDGNRVYLINPYMPLSFIYYDEDTEQFHFHTEPIYIRNLGGDASVDSRVTETGKTFRCVKAHSGNAAKNKPPVGDSWEDYWVLEGKAPSTGAPSAWGAGTQSRVRVAIGSETNNLGESETTVTVWGYYKCIQNHTASASTKPNTGAAWTAYWTLETKSSDSQSGFRFGQNRVAHADLWVSGTSYTAGTNNYVTSVEEKKWIDADGFPSGFSAGCLSQGRLWVANVLGEKNTIYFSQSIIKDKHYQRMYQFADPLNPDDPDVVDTDGGTLRLTAADEIVGLVDYIGGVLVLATNGVWYITGSDGYFKATAYNIKKVSEDGCLGRSTWIAMENQVVYGSVSGIYATSLDDISNEPVVTEISNKIRDFWARIPNAQRELAEFAYNPDTFSMYITLNFTNPTNFSTWNPYTQSSRKRDMLIYHTKLRAWYKYSLSDDDNQDKVTIGGIMSAVVNLSDFETVTVSGVAVTVGVDTVTTPVDQGSAATSTLVVLMKRSGNNTSWSIGHLNGSTFQDFSKNAADTESYSSYVESVPQLYSDAGHRKQVPYLYTLFDRVESGFDESTGVYLNQGGCFYRVVWNWSTNSTAKKWGTAYQAYKPNRFNYIYEDGTLLAYSVVRNRHRIRGTGPALAFRFESDGDKDFHLLGWQADLEVDEHV